MALAPAVASRAARSKPLRRVKGWRTDFMKTSFREDGWQGRQG
jgi:hypothetical protein